MATDGLIDVQDISARTVNSRRSEFNSKTIPKKKRQEYEENGWEFVPSKLKKSVTMRKLKKHDVAFEERVWALFAKMGFELINANNKFRLTYQEGLTKQIDVFAADSETILVVECKSSESRKRVGYQKDINEFVGLQNRLRVAAKGLVSGGQKVAFIFATSNAILSSNDRLRLEGQSVHHFNQDVIEYYYQLTDHLGKAAKYQLFARLFSGQKIPELKNRIPAVKGKVSAGHTIYSFSIDPDYLLKIGFILHRSDTNPDAAQAYQRLVKKSRLNQIAKYIDGGGYFPNSIIINIETKRKGGLKFEEAEKIPHDGETNFGILHLPKTYRSAFIIDGQHRLYGYSRCRSESHHTIPVVAFHNLPTDEQKKIFVDINHTQKSVPANLLQSLMADFYWDSNNPKLALSAVKTRLLTELNADDDSPFYKRVILAEEKKTDRRCLTIETIRSWGLSRVGFFSSFKGDKLIELGYLTESTNSTTLAKAKLFINDCFKHIEQRLQDQWDRGRGEGGFIAMNIGVTATMRVIDDVLDYLVTVEKVNPRRLSGDQLARKVLPYLDPVVKYIRELDHEGLKKLRGIFGSGATEKVQRHFQSAIHAEESGFNPDGLEQWIRDSSGEFNSPAQLLGHHHIEPLIDEFVKKTLKEEFGKENWWRDGVPRAIQKECSGRQIDDNSKEPSHHFLCTIDYSSIIEANWELLGSYFTRPGEESVKKKKKLAWLARFNRIRIKYSHPQRENITEEEFGFLEEIHAWLREKLTYEDLTRSRR